MTGRINIDALKQSAAGRWGEILSALCGIPSDLLDGVHHPCPKCGGTNRFRAFTDGSGGVICNNCFAAQNGDGIAAVQWLTGDNFPRAATRIADYLGVQVGQNGNGKAEVTDVLAAVCQSKRMPIESAKAYGARVDGSAVVFPSWGPAGEPFSDFTIRSTGGEKQRKGMWPKGGKAGMFLPVIDGVARLPVAGETWLVVEGCKDASALHSLGFLAAGLNTCKMNQRFAPMFRGCHAILIPDRDTASVKGMESSARKLAGVALSIKIAALPAEVAEKDGKDVRDILAQENGEQMVREAIEQSQAWELPRSDDPNVDTRARVFAGPREHEVADKAIKSLASLNGLYQRAGNLVSIVRAPEPPPGIIRPPTTMYICPIDDPGLCDRLSQVVQFYQRRKVGEHVYEKDISPPLRIAKIIHSRRHWPGVPVVEGVVHAPVFLADGGIMTTPGFCKATGLYLAGNCEFSSIPQSPTKADAKQACDIVLETVCDFPYATPAHRSAWLALAITPAARFAFEGPVPLGAFDANVRGSGKTKQADSIGMIHLGDMLPRTALPADEEEFRKRITSTLLAGEQIMLFDNVAKTLGGASLDALLTGTTWSDRILGQSKMTGKLPATTIWFASGNNIAFEADTARRALTVRLQSPDENPEEREGFRHPNLLAWVKANRGKLAAAIVTILRAYHVAGRPKLGLPEWGSFEGWSNLVRNAVVWCGMDDPGATRQAVREESDREAGLLRQLLSAWESADPAGTGITTQESIARAAEGNKLLQGVFAEISPTGKPASPRSIGMKLHHLRGRVAGGRYFERRKGSADVTYWTVQRTDASGTNGTSWTKPYSSYAGEGANCMEGAGTSPTTPTSPTDDYGYEERIAIQEGS